MMILMMIRVMMLMMMMINLLEIDKREEPTVRLEGFDSGTGDDT